jgi:hypothetical protein
MYVKIYLLEMLIIHIYIYIYIVNCIRSTRVRLAVRSNVLSPYIKLLNLLYMLIDLLDLYILIVEYPECKKACKAQPSACLPLGS